MRIAITGARGFIGTNLSVRLGELGHADVVAIPHDADDSTLATMSTDVGFVYHLGGVNRPPSPDDFASGNAGFTARLCRALAGSSRPPAIAFSSTIQARLDNPYGRSKLAAEQAVRAYGAQTGAATHVYRLPNVFGKWSRPNYNSAVATFCHQVAHGLPVTIHDRTSRLRLVYVDNVVASLCALIDGAPQVDRDGFVTVEPEYATTVGDVADTIRSFRDSRHSLMTPRVGTGLVRALHATYLSFLPVDAFAYDVPLHGDTRGVFVEMLKTPDCGQFSYFTAYPGITRGEHYHHSKTEKFLVIQGRALFGFRHIVTGEQHELMVEGGSGRIVETVPGWTHDVTNVGDDDLIVMLWANEVFDRDRPDTRALKVKP